MTNRITTFPTPPSPDTTLTNTPKIPGWIKNLGYVFGVGCLVALTTGCGSMPEDTPSQDTGSQDTATQQVEGPTIKVSPIVESELGIRTETHPLPNMTIPEGVSISCAGYVEGAKTAVAEQNPDVVDDLSKLLELEGFNLVLNLSDGTKTNYLDCGPIGQY